MFVEFGNNLAELCLLSLSFLKLVMYGGILLAVGATVTYILSRVSFIVSIAMKVKQLFIYIISKFVEIEDHEIYELENREEEMNRCQERVSS